MHQSTPRTLVFDLERPTDTASDASKSQALAIRLADTASASVRGLTQAELDELIRSAQAVGAAEQARRRGSAQPLEQRMREHGERLFALLDGPQRSLATALQRATQNGQPLLLVVRLLGEPHGHPAAGLRFELLHDGKEFVTRRPEVRLAVQQGERAITAPERPEHGLLRVLFMAYSPRGVDPVLDFEGEEERILRTLAPNIEKGCVRIEVVEDGTLSELERRLKTDSYDVVYLSGHGELRPDGPCLLMEDDVGDLDRVGTERLHRTLERAQTMPRLVVLQSCETADGRDDVASMAAGLVARGVPAVLGWVRPVADIDATTAGCDLLDRLATGHDLTEAIAFTRRQLAQADLERLQKTGANRAQTFAWATMHLVTRQAAGFQIDTSAPVPQREGPTSGEVYRFLGDGRMRVLREGFIGRRRVLQRLIRILRDGRDQDAARAGAAVIGMKGVGKSCLAGRAIERHAQDCPTAALLVLHGKLDEMVLLERVRRCALECDDRDAEKLLDNKDETVERRVERLLLGRWRRRELVIVLDDFEQNLELQPSGPARLSPFAARLLGVLLSTCKVARAKLLVTCTATFELAPELVDALSEIELGPLEPSDVNKLWSRGRESDLRDVSPLQWAALAERLGRNARVLDWARALLGGRTTKEIDELVQRSRLELPVWKDGVSDPEAQANLARLFLFHAAIDRATSEAHPDVRTFLERARVYEIAVPLEALLPMGDGLQLDLDQQAPALANLGLLEFGGFERQRAYRVSPLVVPELASDGMERWHRVAAEFLEGAAKTADGLDAELVALAWEHALAARAEDIADRTGQLVRLHAHLQGLYWVNHERAGRQVSIFPAGFVSQYLAGDAAHHVARLTESRAHFDAASRIAETRDVAPRDLAELLHAFAGLLRTQGDLIGARQRLWRSLEISRRGLGTDEHPAVAASIHELARVLRDQGDLVGAQECLERSLEITLRLHGTDEDRSVAATRHELAAVLRAQGDLAGARREIECSLNIWQRLLGTDEHPDVASSMHELACVLRDAGDLVGARRQFERVLEISNLVFGTDMRHDVASSLQELAHVLLVEGDLGAARQLLERSLEIRRCVFNTDAHPDVAACMHALASVRLEQGDVSEARGMFERALEIRRAVLGTDAHLDVAATLHELARVLRVQGDLAGARGQLELSLTIKRQVLQTERHPQVAASMHSLAIVLKMQGEIESAIELLRRTLNVEAAIYETREHYSTAETKFALGRMLIENGSEEEGEQHIAHAVQMLRATAPGHPLLRRVEQPAPAISAVELARTALSVRVGAERPESFDFGVKAMLDYGEPASSAGRYIDWLARGGDVDVLPNEQGPRPFADALDAIKRDDVGEFLKQLRQAAAELDAQRSVAP